jgi:hypothetical protein
MENLPRRTTGGTIQAESSLARIAGASILSLRDEMDQEN